VARRTVPLTVSGSVKLSAAGGGQVQLGPQVPGVSWQPAGVACLVVPVSTTVVSQFLLYLGNPQAGNFIGGTYTGDNNSCGVAVNLEVGQVLTGVWTGGNPLAIATMTVTGVQLVPGPA
jgi:hypothetical protein